MQIAETSEQHPELRGKESASFTQFPRVQKHSLWPLVTAKDASQMIHKLIIGHKTKRFTGAQFVQENTGYSHIYTLSHSVKMERRQDDALTDKIYKCVL